MCAFAYYNKQLYNIIYNNNNNYTRRYYITSSSTSFKLASSRARARATVV